jgi:hypothetical protein
MIRAKNGNSAVVGLCDLGVLAGKNSESEKSILSQRRKDAKVRSDLFQDPFDP